MTGVRIGVSPLLWSNDDLPRLGENVPLVRMLTQAASAGYEGVELGHKFPRDPDRLRAALGPFGLSLASGWYGSRLLERSVADELAAAGAHLELLRKLGAEVVVVAEVSGTVHTNRRARLSSRPTLTGHQWTRFTRSLTSFADAVAQRGLRLAYHQHMGTVVESGEDVERLLTASGEAVGLTLDTGHLAFAGVDPAEIARRYGDRVAHVHLKDVLGDRVARVRRRDMSFLNAVLGGAFVIPGEGDVDFPAVLAALADHHYRGWLLVEADQNPARREPLACAGKAIDYVLRVAREAGLPVVQRMDELSA